MTLRTRIVAIAVCAGVALAAPALYAHMKFVKSVPAADATVASPPATVQVWFTEAPDRAVSKLELKGPAGAVRLGALTVDADKSMHAAIEGDVADGAYTVDWQAAGNDGHVQKGSYAFSVRRTR